MTTPEPERDPFTWGEWGVPCELEPADPDTPDAAPEPEDAT